MKNQNPLLAVYGPRTCLNSDPPPQITDTLPINWHSIAKAFLNPGINTFKYLSVLLLYSCVFSSVSTETFSKMPTKTKRPQDGHDQHYLPWLIPGSFCTSFIYMSKLDSPAYTAIFKMFLRTTEMAPRQPTPFAEHPVVAMRETSTEQAGAGANSWCCTAKCWPELATQGEQRVIYFSQLRTNHNRAALRDRRLTHRCERNYELRQELCFSNSCLLVPGSV